jgi:hypothetical protein
VWMWAVLTAFRRHVLPSSSGLKWVKWMNKRLLDILAQIMNRVNRIIDHSQGVTTNKYNSIADIHTTNHSTLSSLTLFPLASSWQQLSTMANPLKCLC